MRLSKVYARRNLDRAQARTDRRKVQVDAVERDRQLAAMSRAEKEEAGKRLLRLTKWSQPEIARELGVTQQAISVWHNELSYNNLYDEPRGTVVTRAARKAAEKDAEDRKARTDEELAKAELGKE